MSFEPSLDVVALAIPAARQDDPPCRGSSPDADRRASPRSLYPARSTARARRPAVCLAAQNGELGVDSLQISGVGRSVGEPSSKRWRSPCPSRRPARRRRQDNTAPRRRWIERERRLKIFPGSWASRRLERRRRALRRAPRAAPRLRPKVAALPNRRGGRLRRARAQQIWRDDFEAAAVFGMLAQMLFDARDGAGEVIAVRRGVRAAPSAACPACRNGRAAHKASARRRE